MKNLLLLLSISFLFSCTQPPKRVESVPTIYNFNGNKIVFLDSYYSDYLKAIKTEHVNRDSLYEEIISTPLYNEYYSKSEYGAKKEPEYYFLYHDTIGLAYNISALIANRAKIEELISSTLIKCNTYLKNESITICIEPCYNDTSKMIQKMHGIFGLTAGSKLIILTIDPKVSAWSDMLEDAVAHEFEHSYWMKVTRSDTLHWTLVNYITSEGRADSYAHFLYPTKTTPWDTALYENEKASLWNRIKSDLNSEDRDLYSKVMFGDKDSLAKYPIWGGYCLGYTIVQSVLKNHPELTPLQWANMKPEEILKMSDYK